MRILFALFVLMLTYQQVFCQTDKKIYGCNNHAEQPEFIGGDSALYAWLGDNLKYPQDAVELGIEGTVVVAFAIDIDGSVDNVRVISVPVYSEIVNVDGVETMEKHEASSMVDEALRVVKLMPKWKPGSIDGRPVRVEYTLPIAFSQTYTMDEVDVQPSFPGGECAMYEWIENNLSYPPEMADGPDVTGTVVVQFVIEKDGTVSDIQTMKSLYPLLDKEAVRVISMMPKWNPGMINGQPVRVSNNIRVKFMLK